MTLSSTIELGSPFEVLLPVALILIVLTSFLTPLFLKLLCRNEPVEEEKELSRGEARPS